MNKGIEQVLSPMHRIMKAVGIKKSKKIPRKYDQVRELQFLVRHVNLSKYLINKIEYTWTWICKSRESELPMSV